MITNQEQIEECNNAVAKELIKPYPNREVLHNLNLRELALILGDRDG